jgi:hypothetical protein
MAESKTTTKPAQPEDEPQDAPMLAEGLEPATGDRPTGTKAYKSDRNLAEVNANEVFYMDPRSEVGKRLLATGYVTETDDPQA